MQLADASEFWLPVCEVVSRLRCWVRIAWRDGEAAEEGHWGQLLTVPTKGYLEASGGPTPIRCVEWVDVAMSRVKGGLAGRPLEIVDAKQEILSAFDGLRLSAKVLQGNWSIPGIFQDEPVQALRIVNPFGPIPRE